MWSSGWSPVASDRSPLGSEEHRQSEEQSANMRAQLKKILGECCANMPCYCLIHHIHTCTHKHMRVNTHTHTHILVYMEKQLVAQAVGFLVREIIPGCDPTFLSLVFFPFELCGPLTAMSSSKSLYEFLSRWGSKPCYDGIPTDGWVGLWRFAIRYILHHERIGNQRTCSCVSLERFSYITGRTD